MSKKWHSLMQALRQFSIATLIFGGMLFINGIPFGKWIITIGGSLYALHSFLLAFERVYIEPDWEIVYPELALGYSDELDESDNCSESTNLK